jgi:hypothetical protein
MADPSTRRISATNFSFNICWNRALSTKYESFHAMITLWVKDSAHLLTGRHGVKL